MAFRSVKIIFRNSDGLSKTVYFKQNIGVTYPTPVPEPVEIIPPPPPEPTPIPISIGPGSFDFDGAPPPDLLPPIAPVKFTPAPPIQDLPVVSLPKAPGDIPEIIIPDIDLSALANLNLPPFDASQIKLDFKNFPINIPKIGPITIPKNISIPGPTDDAGAMKFNPLLKGLMNPPFGGFSFGQGGF